MALIGTIRKNGWILIVMMMLALGGFLLMEYFSNQQRNAAGDMNTLGKVNGEVISRNDFERYQGLIYPNADGDNVFQARQQAWEYFVKQSLFKDLAEAVGIGVSRDELRELQFGNPATLSPVIRDRYSESGQVNMQYLNSVKAAIDADQLVDQPNYPFLSTWVEQEKEVVTRRLEDKFTNLVTKGIYTPTWLGEVTFKEGNERVDFQYVRIPYEKIADSEAPVSDDDYKTFLKNNPNLYDQPNEMRTIAFVAINVAPTAADSMASRDGVAKLVNDFRAATSDSIFMLQNGGSYSSRYTAKSALPAIIADSLVNRPVGSVVGPYLDGGNWVIAKISDRKVLPDSVRARHILIKGGPEAKIRLDSFKTIIAAGKARFDSLATKNSEDPGSAAKGGDLGWFSEGVMVPEFNEVCFNSGELNKLYLVNTQFGWHLLEVTGKKFIKNEAAVKTQFLSAPCVPSKATQRAGKERAESLVQRAKNVDDLKKLAEESGLTMSISRPVSAADHIIDQLGAGNDVRNVIRWAFEAKTEVNDVSKELFIFRSLVGGVYDSKYVVAGLKGISEKGKANIASLKANPEADLKVKNQKKGEYMKGKIQNVSDLAALAAQYEARVDTARGSSMQSGGSEARVVGTIFSMQKGAVSAPIAGNSGVYVVSPITDIQSPNALPADMTLPRNQARTAVVSAVRMNLVNALKKQADIKDSRGTFF